MAVCGMVFPILAAESAGTNSVRIVELQGSVQFQPAGAQHWFAATNDQPLHAFDRIRTAANSRVALRWSTQSVVPFGASTELEVLPPKAEDTQAGLHLIRGIISFFHRDKPGRIHIITRGAVAGVEGTEFVLAVNDADRTTLSVVNGKVKISNPHGALTLTNSEQAVVDLGQAPRRTPGFIANNLLQWCFYYPTVIDPAEIPFSADDQKELADSLAAYRSGDLQLALQQFPTSHSGSDAEKLYHAAVLLSVGDVAQTGMILDSLTKQAGRIKQLADALRQLIAAVKLQPSVLTNQPQLASELLADSYFQQSRAMRDISLRKALLDAKQAAAKSPKFGFAWERVAELEFSFGRTKDALKALNKSLALAPRNAQALALKGFILNAENDPHAALASFNAAIAADPALGNAWLGRGIVRIRLRDTETGRGDLLVAAALEPQRSELRSYLGKAYMATGDYTRATKELNNAKRLDPNDPTPWLYSALEKQSNNKINDAIRDLEKSQELNNNRSVYRSQLLLDKDQAVRSADLAGIYQDAGMSDWAMIEGQRAVSYDYANYSSHLFLANSYDQLRDPNWSNLRYETPAASEYTIAMLLAPSSAGVLSSFTAQQPYIKLFDQNRVGVSSDTKYLSRGSWFENGGVYGTYNNFSYSFDADYVSDNGQRVNNDNNRRFFTLTVKNQFTPQDSAFFMAQQGKISSGNIGEYYNQPDGSSELQIKETQRPNLRFGYHHEWSPGSHTLFYAAHEVAYESAYGSNAVQNIGDIMGGVYIAQNNLYVNQRVRLDPEFNSVELQQIFQTPEHATIVGTRFQWGQLHNQNDEWSSGAIDINGDASTLFDTFPEIINQDITRNFYHYTAYGYHTWQIVDPFSVTAGLDYDWLHQPTDASTTPFATGEKATVQFSPKAGFIWNPFAHTTLRGAYTHSLSGFANGQSARIEPTEVAGFNQAYRSLAPETVVGDTSGSKFDTFDLSVEQRFKTGTYLALSGQLLYSKLNQVQGAFVFNGDNPDTPVPLGFYQTQNFHEQSLLFSLNQLLGKQWAVGANYRLSRAKLGLNYVDFHQGNLIVTESPFQPYQNLTSILNRINLHANWNHPCGLFAIFSADWYHQNNSGFTPVEPGDDFWQFNAYAGYRMFHRRVEFTVGLLNIFDQNYKLEPLNFYNEMPRSRTFLARLRINF